MNMPGETRLLRTPLTLFHTRARRELRFPAWPRNRPSVGADVGDPPTTRWVFAPTLAGRLRLGRRREAVCGHFHVSPGVEVKRANVPCLTAGARDDDHLEMIGVARCRLALVVSRRSLPLLVSGRRTPRAAGLPGPAVRRRRTLGTPQAMMPAENSFASRSSDRSGRVRVPRLQARSGALSEASAGPTLDRPVMLHALVPVSTLVSRREDRS